MAIFVLTTTTTTTRPITLSPCACARGNYGRAGYVDDPLPNIILCIWLLACIVWLYYTSSSTVWWFLDHFFPGPLKEKKSKDQAGFESMTTAPPASALVRSANPARQCWRSFFATFIHLVTIILTLKVPFNCVGVSVRNG